MSHIPPIPPAQDRNPSRKAITLVESTAAERSASCVIIFCTGTRQLSSCPCRGREPSFIVVFFAKRVLIEVIESSQLDRANSLFGPEYFRTGFGGIPYERNTHWLNFFGGIADRIVDTLA